MACCSSRTDAALDLQSVVSIAHHRTPGGGFQALPYDPTSSGMESADVIMDKFRDTLAALANSGFFWNERAGRAL